MSDVYAMGGEVLFALQIAAWPDDAPLSQLERIFAGAVDKVREAGGVVAGGHTGVDREAKVGPARAGRGGPAPPPPKDAPPPRGAPLPPKANGPRGLPPGPQARTPAPQELPP